MDKWLMTNGNTEWVKPETLANIDKILDYLEDYGSNNKYCSIKLISDSTGIKRPQVKTALHLLAYRVDPWVRLVAINIQNKITNKVIFIKKK